MKNIYDTDYLPLPWQDLNDEDWLLEIENLQIESADQKPAIKHEAGLKSRTEMFNKLNSVIKQLSAK